MLEYVYLVSKEFLRVSETSLKQIPQMTDTLDLKETDKFMAHLIYKCTTNSLLYFLFAVDENNPFPPSIFGEATNKEI